MPPIKLRQSNPSRLIEYGEIEIPDDDDLGAGCFITRLKPNALFVQNIINSQMMNVPVFQISVNINGTDKEVSVLLGKADGSDPVSRRVFELPREFDFRPERLFTARFKDWKVTALEVDGTELMEAEQEE